MTDDEIIKTISVPETVKQDDLKPLLKDKVLKAIKEFNNTLTDNDYDFSVLYYGVDTININEKDNIIDIYIAGKNNATGVSQVSYPVQKVNKISIKQFNKNNIGSLKKPWYSDVPDLTKKSVVIAEMNTGILPAIQKINPNLKTSDYNIMILDFSHKIFNDRDEGDFRADVTLSYSLIGKNWLTDQTVGLEITVPAVSKKTK